MRYNDLINEADTGADEYQQLQNFMKVNQTPGVPPEQQVALALFRELQRTQQHNNQLDAELKAAEQRIDVATKGGEMQKQALGKHQAELEKERGDIEQQQAAMGKLDKTYSEREMANKAQIKNLTDRLEQVKSKPGVDPKATAKLEKEISDLKKNGVSVDKVSSLEKSIAAVQQMHQVDDKAINDLMSKVNAAQEKAKELEKTKQDLGQNLDKTSSDIQSEIDQIKQQLAHFREVEQTLASVRNNVDSINQEFDDTTKAVVDLELKTREIEDQVTSIGTAYGKQAVANASQMIRQQPQQAAQAQRLPKADPRAIAQNFVTKGDLTTIGENQLLKAIKWATDKK